jgi:hypothetical protein
MTKVQFYKFGSSTAIGSFAPGDVLTCSDAMARHLVEVAQVARPVEAEKPQPTAQPARKTRRKAAE